jgi:hypothetical protein
MIGSGVLHTHDRIKATLWTLHTYIHEIAF